MQKKAPGRGRKREYTAAELRNWQRHMCQHQVQTWGDDARFGRCRICGAVFNGAQLAEWQAKQATIATINSTAYDYVPE